MTITLNDSRPIGLCVSTEELFDTKRFLLNYCDGLILRDNDKRLINKLVSVKRELNSFRAQSKFFNGYKAVMTSNIDKIIGLVTARYSSFAPAESDKIVAEGKRLISKILKANTFDDIAKLESEFKSRITLPTYKLFINKLKRSDLKVV